MFDRNFITLWDRFDVDFTCSSVRQGQPTFSTIDHFIMSEGSEVKDAQAAVSVIKRNIPNEKGTQFVSVLQELLK